MLLGEIAYMILEQIRSNNIVDDEEIDIRLVKAWIHIKRSDIIKNKVNSGQDINPVNAQKLDLGFELISTYTGSKSTTRYHCGSSQDYRIFKSLTTVPEIIMGYSGPLVLELTSEDMMQYPFSFVPFSQLRFSGVGRFSSKGIYGSIDVDNHVYLKYNKEIVVRPTAVLKAIFEDPTKDLNFDEETDNYPCSLDIVEAIKNSVFDKDFRVLLNSTEDTQNSANDEF